MSTPIDIRLTGRQATPQAIARVLHRHLGSHALARVELHYSTQADPPLAAQACKQAIANLLREHGQSLVAVSVRRHEGAMDDAAGEHLLRLMPATQRPAAATTVAPTGWRGWLARLFGGGLQGGRAALSPRVEPAAMPAAPAISRAEAVKLLRAAVLQATAYIETDTGTALVGAEATGQGIGVAVVTVRAAELNQVLEPLVQQDPRAIAQMVQSAGLALAEGFAVRYRFRPHQDGDGTALANESDVEVRLVIGPAAQAAAPSGAVAGCEPAVQGPVVGGTALPAGGFTAMPLVLPRPPAPVLTVRVLGTLERAFDQPFELHFAALPARFDRQALQQAGFEQRHPGLLAVASNQCPLTVEAGADGRLVIQAASRPDAGGISRPMYYDAHSQAGVTGARSLAGGRALLIVNSPGGVADPATGRHLPALLIELEAGDNATRQGELPLAA